MSGTEMTRQVMGQRQGVTQLHVADRPPGLNPRGFLGPFSSKLLKTLCPGPFPPQAALSVPERLLAAQMSTGGGHTAPCPLAFVSDFMLPEGPHVFLREVVRGTKGPEQGHTWDRHEGW